MDLSTLKRMIESGQIRTNEQFKFNMLLMFQNAMMYNSIDHDVAGMATDMYEDVMQHIEVLFGCVLGNF